MKVEKILEKLVSIDTIEDKGNREIMDFIEDFFAKYGFDVNRTENEKTGKEVLVAHYGDDPILGFLGHTDTVDITDGWETDPFKLTEKDGNLYGLGTCDMKGGIAAFMAAIAETDLPKLKRGISIYCTYDEEIMFEGILDLVNMKTDFAPHVVVAEPTDNVPMIGSKGLLEYILTFKGITTHSSEPIEGKNSNKNAVKFLNRMIDFEQELRTNQIDLFAVPYTTMNIGILEGGTAINKVPAETKVYMDFRICDSEKEYQLIRRTVDEALEGLDANYQIINDTPSFISREGLIDIFEEMTGEKGKADCGITEASFFEGDKVIIGPGPLTAHQKNECVSKESLYTSKELYMKIIERMCF